MKKVLIACEFSGVGRLEFEKQGFDAWSCDLRETEIPGNHIVGDVLPLLEQEWDLIIAHPPCTYLCNSGVRWLYEKDGSRSLVRWVKMQEAASFFLKFWKCKCKRVVIENPIMHGHAKKIIGMKQSQIVHPHQHGHGESKATCLWERGLVFLKPTDNVPGRKQRLHRLPPSADRSRLRSISYPGILKAMAIQYKAAMSQEVTS